MKRAGIFLGIVVLGGCSVLVDLNGLAGSAGDAAAPNEAGLPGTGDGSSLGDGGPGGGGGDAIAVLPDGAPVPTVLLSGGGDHTCAAVNGVAKCWGKNDHGQLGVPGLPYALAPTLVPGVVTANAGTKGENTCALLDDAGLLCWGWNDQGQLGDGSGVDRDQPVLVQGL